MTTNTNHLPTTLFSLVRTEHQDCSGCEAMANPAASMARGTGSTEAAYSRDDHGARVRRIRNIAA